MTKMRFIQRLANMIISVATEERIYGLALDLLIQDLKGLVKDLECKKRMKNTLS